MLIVNLPNQNLLDHVNVNASNERDIEKQQFKRFVNATIKKRFG